MHLWRGRLLHRFKLLKKRAQSIVSPRSVPFSGNVWTLTPSPPFSVQKGGRTPISIRWAVSNIPLSLFPFVPVKQKQTKQHGSTNITNNLIWNVMISDISRVANIPIRPLLSIVLMIAWVPFMDAVNTPLELEEREARGQRWAKVRYSNRSPGLDLATCKLNQRGASWPG